MRRYARLTLALIFILQPWLAASAGSKFGSPAAQLLAELTPAERVGQLFIVSFRGTNVEPDSDIYRLITESHIGGVVLLASQDNFTDPANLPGEVLTLTNRLQSAALGILPATPTPAPTATEQIAPQASSTAEATPPGTIAPEATQASVTPAPISFRRQTTATLPPQTETPASPLFTPLPLFIGISHEGLGAASTQIRSGMTELPSPMAIGATWQPAQAEAIGQITGRELAAMGLNMLLGPSLDVLFSPHPEASGDLGTRSFGGEPFWVGQMGAAFVRGVHAGSNGQILVVAQHFPGLGGSDRLPEEEIPTIPKSLDQLKPIELLPFFAVTGRQTDPAATADGLLISHIRYQGNIRQFTRPISLDQQTFAQLFALPELSAWREGGGLIVSDSLGVRAIKRFYDSTEQTFPARKIALDAFLAGNDLLLLTDFGLNPAVDQTATVQDVIASFVQKYQDDPAFAERVDAAVTRILARKTQLYGSNFTPEAVLKDPSGLEEIGTGQAAVFGVAQNAVTLVSPSPVELVARVPDPPQRTESIVIFTDVRQTQQCSDPAACPPKPVLGVDTLRQDILRLYGPGGGGQVRAGDIQSFSFADLLAYLEGTLLPQPGEAGATPEPPPLAAALDQADWIVFAMLDVDPAIPASRALKEFLAARPDVARLQKVIVFAFDAPYYLDSTEISKLTAYFALYSPAGAFHEVAARVLFQELSPRGSSPVSVAGVAYDLIEQTAPDPSQVIEILIAEPTEAQPGPTPTPMGTAGSIGVGEVLFLRTGVIRDRNGNPVPDGTVVRFIVQYPAEGVSVPIPDTTTVGGVAQAAFIPPRSGQIEIRAESQPALTSVTLQIRIEGETIVAVTIQPTLPPSDTPEPSATPTVTPTVVETSAPATDGEEDGQRGNVLEFVSLVVSLIAFGLIALRVGRERSAHMRLALAAMLGALVGYNYYALRLPGAAALGTALPFWGAILVTWIGGVLGFGAGWFTWYRTPSQEKR